MDGSRRAEGDESYKEGPPEEKIFFPPSTISSSSHSHIHLLLLTQPLLLYLFIFNYSQDSSVFPAVVHGLSNTVPSIHLLTNSCPWTSHTVSFAVFLSAALFCHRRASLFHPNPCRSDNIYA
ncbi:hypothetical protein A4X13_0g8355 [Tilletia indica]|uniref:Uncharacterized protein n=1 Tax=Tilletia indica TaxID=43049 RepID=A0A8T8SF55_9BASI|nr:hypothetical protein A4X13_0g8355 [Tilletia indica]